MSTLKQLHEQQLFETFLYEMADGREDIIEVANNISTLLKEYNNEARIEGEYLIEAALAGELGTKELTRLFRAASDISQGKSPKKGLFTKASDAWQKTKAGAGKAKDLAVKMVATVKKGAEKLQNTEPVQAFDLKVDKILGDWKQKLGNDHKAVKLAQQLGEFGKQNPKKTAFIIAVLSALAGFAGTPAFGAAAGMAMRTAMGLAKGEKASTQVGKAAAFGAIGGAAGMVGDAISGAGEAGADAAAGAGETGVEGGADAEGTRGQYDYEGGEEDRRMDIAAMQKGMQTQMGPDLEPGEKAVSGGEVKPEATNDVSSVPAEAQKPVSKLSGSARQMFDDKVSQYNMPPENQKRFADLLNKGEKFSIVQGVPVDADQMAELQQEIGGKPSMDNMGKVGEWLAKKGLKKSSQ